MVKLSVNYERTNECLCVQKAETFICLAKTRDPNYAFACEKGREREREREREWNIIQGEGGKEENVGGKEWK